MSDTPEVHFVGRLGSDPELRFTNGGKAVANFSFVVSRKWKDANGEWQEVPTWLNVSCWDKMGENVAESLKKGDRVRVSGVLENRKYEDRDGETRYSLEIRADDVAASLRWDSVTVNRVDRRTESTEDRPARQQQKARSKPKPDPVEEEFGTDYVDSEEPF